MGREESDTTEQLHFPFSLSCIGEGNGNPLQCSCLENPNEQKEFKKMTQNLLRSHHESGVYYICIYSFEMATHSSVLAWRIPGTGKPGGLPSMGSHRVGHDWSDLASQPELSYMTKTTCKEGWEIRRKHRYVREQFILPKWDQKPFPSIITQDTFTCMRKYIYSSIVPIVKIWKFSQQKLLLSRWINNFNMTYLWNETLCRVKRNKLNTYEHLENKMQTA